MAEYESMDDLHDAELSDHLVVKSAGEVWLAWFDDDGEWWACRPRGEGDEDEPTFDRNRPVGPVPLERLSWPLQAVTWTDVFTKVEDVEERLVEARRMATAAELRASDLTWAANMNRQGGA